MENPNNIAKIPAINFNLYKSKVEPKTAEITPSKLKINDNPKTKNRETINPSFFEFETPNV